MCCVSAVQKFALHIPWRNNWSATLEDVAILSRAYCTLAQETSNLSNMTLLSLAHCRHNDTYAKAVHSSAERFVACTCDQQQDLVQCYSMSTCRVGSGIFCHWRHAWTSRLVCIRTRSQNSAVIQALTCTQTVHSMVQLPSRSPSRVTLSHLTPDRLLSHLPATDKS